MYVDIFALHNNLLNSARLAHWNVTGQEFYSQHLLFERIYKMLEPTLDTLAEQLRGMGIIIEANYLRQIDDLAAPFCDHLLQLATIYRNALSDAITLADNENRRGLSNVLQGVSSDIDTITYLLQSQK